MFGGKGHFINFYDTGDELFDIMQQLEQTMGVRSFFVMDENFLLHRKRALRLLELLEEHDKAWSLYVFASANILRSYSLDQLLQLGISWVWMGLEGEDTRYKKLHGTDTRALVRELQSHGIHVLGSTIIGLEEHSPQNIDQAIDSAVRYDTDFHQFMLYTPLPGTPLHAELKARGVLDSESDDVISDMHGQYRFNYRHGQIKDGLESELIVRAFRKDFEVNGPSVVRLVRTMLTGWKRHKHHQDPRVRRRFAFEARDLPTTFAALLGASQLYYRKNAAMQGKVSKILRDLVQEFGFKARLAAALGGPFLLWKMRREEKRLTSGWTREPRTFFEKNHGPAPVASVSIKKDLTRVG